MTNHDDIVDDSSPHDRAPGPPGADGDLDSHHNEGGDWDATDNADAPPPASDSTEQSENHRPEPSAESGSQQTGVDAFVDNTATILRRSTDVLPYIWIAIVIVGLIPTMWKVGHGYDPLDPFGADFELSIFAVEIFCQVTALTLLAAAFPVGRACLFSDDEHVRTFDGGTDVLFEHLLDALPVAIIYYVAVMAGLMMCIAPGLFAAVFFLPALYLATTRQESLLKAFLKAPVMINRHSTKFAILIVGFLIANFLAAMAAVFAFGALVPDGDLGAALTNPLFMVVVSLATIIATAVSYFFYVALIGLFVTAEEGERSS